MKGHRRARGRNTADLGRHTATATITQLLYKEARYFATIQTWNLDAIQPEHGRAEQPYTREQ